jgi:hypothetical protein
VTLSSGAGVSDLAGVPEAEGVALALAEGVALALAEGVALALAEGEALGLRQRLFVMVLVSKVTAPFRASN